ncbi:MAG: hypothetical protein FWH37_00075 [Candidatus Bathyarchaeota archaeon]|nr:hypothetical protein [Candidatus Termiticorpusculum sp.]
MNKKITTITITILLCVTMFASIILPATAQTTTNTNQPTTPTRNPACAQSVCDYVNVGNPNNIIGTNTTYIILHPSSGKIIINFNTTITKGSYIGIYAKGNGQLTVYVSYGVPGNNPPHVVTHSINNSNGAWYYGIAPITFNYMLIITTGNVQIDCVAVM